jgi:hypothetical protein
MFTATQVSDDQAAQIADYLKSLAVAAPAAPAAPATLPKSGGEMPVSAWPIVLMLTGLMMLLAGVLTQARRKA